MKFISISVMVGSVLAVLVRVDHHLHCSKGMSIYVATGRLKCSGGAFTRSGVERATGPVLSGGWQGGRARLGGWAMLTVGAVILP